MSHKWFEGCKRPALIDQNVVRQGRRAVRIYANAWKSAALSVSRLPGRILGV